MSPLTIHYSPFTEFAHTLADAAGAVIRPYFGAHGDVEQKRDDSPVTMADRGAEEAMRALITAQFPDHGIYGEEFGTSGATGAPLPSGEAGLLSEPKVTFSNPGEGAYERVSSRPHPDLQPHHLSRNAMPTSSYVPGEVVGANPTSPAGRGAPASTPAPRYTWVLDPIDGTRAFIAGHKQWGTLIALCENGVPILGILDQPVTGERWVGVKGQATTYAVTPGLPRGPSSETDGSRRKAGMTELCHTRPCASLAEASVSTTSRRYFTAPQAVKFARLAEQCRDVIEDGDCYAYGLLARGERDIVIDAGLKPYDILALVPIIEGAGGKITTWDGAGVTLENYRDVVAVGDGRISITLF